MYSLVETNIVKSVLQNINLILTTVKGSDIHRPDFGVPLELFQDKPLTTLDKGKIKAEIVEAIETYEPRAKVLEVDIIQDFGHITIKLFLDIEGEQVKTDVKVR